MHGFAKVAGGEGLYAEGSAIVRTFLSELVAPHGRSFDQPKFDARHRAACGDLRDAYLKGHFPEFHDGQGQKWLNMALKYAFTFGDAHLPGYSHVFALAHIPIDNIILDALRERGLPPLTAAWSRVGYEEYMGVQNWVRSTFTGSPPLAVEFHLFQNSDDTTLPE